MRTLSLFFALLLSQSLNAESWVEVKTSLQARHPEYDDCFARALNMLRSSQEVVPEVLQALHIATQEIIEKLPDFIQQTINHWPNYWQVDADKWRSIGEMHHADCILAGAVQLRLAIEMLHGNHIRRLNIRELTTPAARMLQSHMGFGPHPNDTQLRKTFARNISTVRFSMVDGGSTLTDKDLAQLMLKDLDCPQVLLGYSSPAFSFP